MFSTSNSSSPSSSTSMSAYSKISAPVVQSRLEHHHQQQLQQQQKAAHKLSKSEVRPNPQQQQQQQQQHHHQQHQHQRSKSLSRGKRSQKENSTAIVQPPSITTILSRPSSKNNSSLNHHRVDSIVDHDHFTEIEQLSLSNTKFGKQQSSGTLRKSNSSNGILNAATIAAAKNVNPTRRHHYSESFDATKVSKNNPPPMIILQRPKSATDFVRKGGPVDIPLPLEEETSEQVPMEQQQQQQRRSPNKTEKSQQNRLPSPRERRRSDVPQKTKRVQRRREIKSEVLPHVDTNTLLSQSPSQPSSMQQESSDESDVNSNTYMKRVSNMSPQASSLGEHHSLAGSSKSNNSVINSFSVVNGKISFPESLEAMDLSLNSIFERSPNKDFKRHSDSFIPSQSVAIPNSMPRRQSSTAIELQSQLAGFADSNNAQERHSSTPIAGPSTSPRFANQKYAGPTFAHSSPEASQLPLPSFVVARQEPNDNLSGIPEFPVATRVNTPASSTNGNRSEDENMFVMDDVESQSHDDKMKSVDILTLLSMSFDSRTYRQQQRQEQFNQLNAYNVPAHMATSRPLHVYPRTSGGDYLTEISENLRSLLKIQGQ